MLGLAGALEPSRQVSMQQLGNAMVRLMQAWPVAAAPPAARNGDAAGGDAAGDDAVGDERPLSERPLGVKAALYALVLLPPVLVASSDPSLFFAALDNAGTFGILTLFGILPPAMAWQQRYGPEAAPAAEPAVPGGRATLALMIGAASAVIGLEVAQRMVGAAA